MSQRPVGICADPLGRCQFQGQQVTLYMGNCRPCYDRLRNSNPENKKTMPNYSPPPATTEEKSLLAARKCLFDFFRLSSATEDQTSKILDVAGPLFRPILPALEEERAKIENLFKRVPPITAQQDSTAQVLAQPQPQPQPQPDSTTQQSQPASTDITAQPAQPDSKRNRDSG